jgi:hypothetical protein
LERPLFYCGGEMRGGAAADKPPGRAERRKSRKKRIEALQQHVEKQLTDVAKRATVADLIRLMQMEKELEEEKRPREIVITWVEPVEQNEPGG